MVIIRTWAKVLMVGNHIFLVVLCHILYCRSKTIHQLASPKG